jgi:2'-5' RNA ligase
MLNKSLYFIALVPPEPFRQQAWEMKEHFREEYQSKASMNSPPHITLHPPFKLKQEGAEEKLEQALQELASGFKPFEARLKNYGAFKPRVIFIDVEKEPAMEKLQKRVVERVMPHAEAEKKRAEPAFHPHMTLAFRDLSKDNFHRAWKEYESKELSYSWEVSQFVLLKHNGKHWEEHRQFSLRHD